MKNHTKNILYSVLSVLFVILFLFPVIWMVLCSFKPDIEIFRIPPSFLPENGTLQPYKDQLKSGLVQGFRNSSVIAFCSMLIALLLSIPAAYGLARFRSPMKKTVILWFLVTQMLPASLLLTPLYLLFTKIHLVNTLWAPIFATVTGSIPFVVILMRPFFASLPKAVEEAARVDGCTMFGAFIRIMLPVARGGIITAAIFSFIFPWNDLAYSLAFVANRDLWPMTTMINDYQTKYGTQWNSIMAYAVCLIIPVFLVFVFLQKYVITGLTSGAVKE